ncbi:mitogen-activated protein kinase kinase kinase 18-like [Phragmites australis]|uniref:mitogen-activated protein kinase kinase kinase 18-like n=1 Tax=Phragmites australis TaxID=29695 RepID=UPI002D76D40F|nr:mitogen-activated protein kinase kinase kinase 18-like [Phragmites australis]
MAAVAVSGHWRKLQTLGRGASGAVVSLVADGGSGGLFAVKSAAAADAALLRREHGILAGLCSPHVVRCIGCGEGLDGSYHLFLEYAPGGSLADEVARNGGHLEERAVWAYAADVLRGLAYLHGKSIVHGDVKARNVVIGADGRARLADFGCARTVGSARPIGGTPAFMAPEVARGEEQGPAADVWALGCTVIEMATGRAPWSDMDDVLSAVHRIGYTDAVPEVSFWLSAEAKDFLARCFVRNARDRSTAAQLLEHPFVTLACHDEKSQWVSPKSTLDAAFGELETDDEADEMAESPAERIKSLAGYVSTLPDWDCEEGWIDVLGEDNVVCGVVHVARSAPSKVSSAAAVPAGEMAVGGGHSSDELETDDVSFGGDVLETYPSVECQTKRCLSSDCDVLSFELVLCNGVNAIKLWFPTKFDVLLCLNPPVYTLFSPNFHQSARQTTFCSMLNTRTHKYGINLPQ